ncbi:MAG: cysteine-rich CWC family protein [Rubrivivax sp.]|nr:cysteine-rich CWC family protein [Rubrivivax sp.]
MAATPPAPPLPPQREHACPLCGRANDCAAARTGSFASACWCASTTFGAELLSRVPAAQAGRACICRACAEAAAGAATEEHRPEGSP